MAIKRILAAVCLFLMPASAFASARVVIVNGNAPGVGFNDSTPVAPAGGNPGTTLGQQRLLAFQFAADVWGRTLDSSVPVLVLATFEPLTCSATSAVLGSAGARSIFANFPGAGLSPGALLPNTWHGGALANKRAGFDLDPASASDGGEDIRARFNSSLGAVDCLTGTGWYLGFDTNHGKNIDLVTVLLHEFAHGLGFQQFGSVTNGSLILDMADVYNVRMFDKTTGLYWPAMTNAQRVASAINSRRVIFDGTNVTEAIPAVLQLGTPLLRITTPVSLAGIYAVGAAAFGPALTQAGLSGSIVSALDAADGAGPSTTDGCSAITNPGQVAGNIALVDRGTCGFVVKVKNAQNAGAIAVVVADNAAGGPPAGLGGVDPTITIPSVRITLADGNAVKAQLASGVAGTLGLDMLVRAGADEAGKALLNAPNPVQPGSSISHWDPIAARNQLMEPAINGDLTHQVAPPEDLTLPLLRDIGWFPDRDLDGLADNLDSCQTSDLRGTVFVGSVDTGVANVLFTSGCTIGDLIAREAAGAGNHGAFVSGVAHLLNDLKSAGLITGAQKGVIQSTAAKSSLP
ncbi:MAG: PA domain-containing protein [Acidobacteriota bacterium]